MLPKLLVVLGLAALATTPLQAQDNATVAKTINDLEVQWGASMSAGNWAAVQTFLTPDYIITGEDGKRIDRATYISSMGGGDKLSTMTAGPYTVTVSGGTAVHLGEATFTRTDKKGKVTKIHEVWTDTWVRQANGQWLCMATQYVDHVLK